jgi:hypothetical protein
MELPDGYADDDAQRTGADGHVGQVNVCRPGPD